MMKFSKKKSSKRIIPNTVEWKMSEYDRLYSPSTASSVAPSTSPSTAPSTAPSTSLKVSKKNKNKNKKKQVQAKAKGQEKPMSISVNGKPFLEIHPGAKMDDVQTFLNSLQQDISAKVEEVKAEVNDDDNFNRQADAVVGVVDNYEEKLGKSFRALQEKMQEEQYEEKIGKSFRGFKEGVAKSQRDVTETVTDYSAKASDATSQTIDAIEKTKRETAEAVAKGIDEVKFAPVKLQRKMGSSFRNLFKKEEAPKQLEASEETANEVAVVETPAAIKEETVKDSSRPSTPKEEEKASSRPSTPKEEEAAAPKKVQNEAVTAPTVEAPAIEDQVAAALGEAETFDKRVRSGLGIAQEGLVEAAAAIQPGLATAQASIADAAVAMKPGLINAVGSFADTVSGAVVQGQKVVAEKLSSPGASSPRAVIHEDANMEPNIECVEQDNQILLGFYDPSLGKENQQEEGDGVYLNDAAYNLSLMMDGAVVQTMALSAAAMEVLTCCVSEAKKTAGVKEQNNDIIESPIQDEASCSKGRISPLTIPNDLTKEENNDAEVNPTTNASSKEAEQGVIHPFIAEKMTEFFAQAKASFEQLPPVTNNSTPAQATAPVSPTGSEKSESTQQSWFDTSALTKGMRQMSAYLTPPASPVEGAEENRNDEAVNPAMNAEVRV